MKNVTGSPNGTETEQELDFRLTELKLDPGYNFYYTFVAKFILTGLIPFLYLTVLNIVICLNLRRTCPPAPPAPQLTTQLSANTGKTNKELFLAVRCEKEGR